MLKEGERGHLFQGRYRAVLVEKDEYAKELSRYIHLNPVRAGVVELPEEYEWSSYPVYIGKKEKPEWLFTDFIHGYFDRSKSSAEKYYREFVSRLINAEYSSPLNEAVGSAILGREDFIREIKEKYLSGENADKEIPALRVLTDRVSAEDLYMEAEKTFSDDPVMERNIKIYLTKRYTEKLLKEIGDEFGIGESAVSQVCRRLSARIEKDKRLKKGLAGIIKRLRL